MIFDYGFDCRPAAVVADPAYAVQVNDFNTYPTTKTNANGLSINCGWMQSSGIFGGGPAIGPTLDPRLYGFVADLNVGPFNFQFRVDLSSGSAPGIGAYLTDIAIGDAGQSRTVNFRVLDTASAVLTVASATYHAGPPVTYIDASGGETNVTDGSGTPITWAGPQVPVTFTTTEVYVDLNYLLTANQHGLAHFRLTEVVAAGGGFVPNRRTRRR